MASSSSASPPSWAVTGEFTISITNTFEVVTKQSRISMTNESFTGTTPVHPPASEELFTWMNQKLGTERAGEC